MKLYFVPVFVVLVNGSLVYCAYLMYRFDNVVTFVCFGLLCLFLLCCFVVAFSLLMFSIWNFVFMLIYDSY